MILESELFKIGKLVKPHGIKGEMSFDFDNDIFDRADCLYLVCSIEGIFVPFFIEEYRFQRENRALIKFLDYNDNESVRFLTGVEVFYPRKYFDEHVEKNENIEHSWNYFIDFCIVDDFYGEIGIIDAIDESTINTLFIIKGEDKEILIPATEDFILGIDAKNKILKMKLPSGLLD